MVNQSTETTLTLGGEAVLARRERAPRPTSSSPRDESFDASRASARRQDESEDAAVSGEETTLWIAKQRDDRVAIEQPLDQGQRAISATVLEAREQNFRCELHVSHGSRTVLLPKALFSWTPEYGTPITLSVHEDSGVRRMEVSRREADASAVNDLKDEMEDLIQRL